MPFSFHPPTGRPCDVCDELHTHDTTPPIIDTHNGKASSANNFPFHNWYNFVLGYSPEFPEYMIRRENLRQTDLVLDPFMGTGTTLVTCKQHQIPSEGIDANDFMVDAARAKLNWNLDTKALIHYRDEVLRQVEATFHSYTWGQDAQPAQLSLFAPQGSNGKQDYQLYVTPRRPEMLLQKYISDKPLARALMIDDAIKTIIPAGPIQELVNLALTSILVPISTVRYGPGFGMVKPRDDVPVLDIFIEKLGRMIKDLRHISEAQRAAPSTVKLGDARHLSRYFDHNSVSLMMTSPPYPGDHEYTKHTRLELSFRGYATTHNEFRIIKRRMIRASTTNIFKEDKDKETVINLESIRTITNLIQERLTEDGATSGFEKLYTKLIWEYFGGMHLALQECFAVLRPGGKIALLVSDSHAFKMVHVQTAAILQEIGLRIGYVRPEIILWQLKPSTSHKYWLRENILMLSKPE
jgi:DNA modification methylase